jgi:hypothetical protein
MKDKDLRWQALFLGPLIGLWIVSHIWLSKDDALRGTGTKADGVVVRGETRLGFCQEAVEYKGASGVTRTALRECSNQPELGAEVAVYYDDQDPDRVYVEEWNHWTVWVLTYIWGAPMLLGWLVCFVNWVRLGIHRAAAD